MYFKNFRRKGTLLLFSLCLFCTRLCCADDPELSRIFAQYDREGTIVISSLDGKKTYLYNEERSKKRLSPASTFKILNSLIALEEKILDAAEVIPWDGVQRDFDAWNKDQILSSAFKSSCLWAYQWIAKKVGRDVYTHYLTQINYGNKNPASKLTTFWLKGGSLKITPLEQVAILKKIYLKAPVFSNRSYDTLKKIMLTEQTQEYSLYVKTGAATKNWIGHGWYVGYIETNDQTWFFATNIKISRFEDLALRRKITLDCLRSKGILHKKEFSS